MFAVSKIFLCHLSMLEFASISISADWSVSYVQFLLFSRFMLLFRLVSFVHDFIINKQIK